MRTILTFAVIAATALAESPGSWTGIITDSMCKSNHAMMKSSGPDDQCVRECVRSNPAAYKYVLFDGKNSYKLSNQKLPEQFAARKVVVKGTLFAKTGVIKVDSIAPVR